MNPLNDLATKLVGDGQKPNLYFVSENEDVVGVFTHYQYALKLAKRLDYYSRVWIEDRLNGEVWGNEMHYAEQMKED